MAEIHSGTDCDLIFVAGASRSGTTMLCRLLGLHSKVFGLQETHFFGDLWDIDPSVRVDVEQAIDSAAKLYARQRKEVWGDAPDESDYANAKRLIDALADRSPASVFRAFAIDIATKNGKTIAVEQTPRNIYYAADILELYSHCRVIEVVRDPRAVLSSQRSRWKMRALGAKNVPWKEIIRTFANYHALTMGLLWKKAVLAGQRVAGKPRVMRVRYEDLVSDPDYYVRKICNFIGIGFELNMLNVPHIASSTRINNSASAGIAKDGVDRWMDDLPRGDRAICEYVNFDVVNDLGYQVDKPNLLTLGVFVHMLRYPFHIIGVVLTNPGRLIVQLRGIFGRH